jgi:hypothetical protein
VHIDETDWEYEHETKLVDEDLKLIADRLRADETKKMVNAVEVGSWPACLLICALTAAECQATIAGACRGRTQSTEAGYVGQNPVDLRGGDELS